MTETCARCACELRTGFSFLMSGARHCLRCTLLQPSLLRRSILTAIVVGTIIIAINQGNVILDGHWPTDLYWKVPLSYCVPFFVTTWGALINSRV